MVILLALASVLGAGEPQQPPVASHELSAPPPRALVGRYCVACHNTRLKTAGLTLDTIDVDKVGENVAVWEKAVRKLRARAMPPAGRGLPRPDEAGYDALVSYLETSLDRAAADAPNPGRPDTFHRLNRTEYQNALRDLLAVDVDASTLIPADDASHGFDNVNVGGLSPTLLDRYMSAARKISRMALGSVSGPDARTVVLPLDLTQNDHLDEALPFGTRGGTVFRHTFPQDGDYIFQIRLTRDRDERIEGVTQRVEIELALDGERLHVFELTPPPKKEGDQAAEDRVDNADVDAALKARFPVKAGAHMVTVTFLRDPSALSEGARQPFMADYNGRSMAAIFSVSVAGPFDARGPGDTPSRRRIFVCRPARPADETPCARTVLSTLARRAYRRPVTGAELQDLLGFYKKGRADGGRFEEGIEMALRALLVSPKFLFRIERDPATVPPNTAYDLSDLELASRLSFFLWSSIPDDELLNIAMAGRLKRPAVLERQVRRMLADPRSQALVDNFAGQWLYLRNLSATIPDPRLFPDFDDNLRQAFRRETELFFDSIKNEDRSVLDLLRANYTFANERLAKHYGIRHVYGSHFRRVMLPADSPRGGLLGHASILTVTSYANRTSPVQRGKWVLDNILGMPPPPPLPNVPPLNEGGTGGKILSMRERMVEHRANPVCASCHSLMDPIGLSTENFDAIGRWRTWEGDAPIDASGGLPDGTTFEGVAGLRAALLRRPELFAGTVTEKLLTYAVRRGLEPSDGAAVRAILRSAQKSDYRLSTLILGIANSVPFRMRRSQ